MARIAKSLQKSLWVSYKFLRKVRNKAVFEELYG